MKWWRIWYKGYKYTVKASSYTEALGYAIKRHETRMSPLH